MFDFIAKPFGALLLWLNNLVGSYGLAIFLFAVVVKLIMLPFQMKSKKSMMRMAALNPQIQELQKRHEGNQQKLQLEIQKLYKEEKVNPMSGCLWSLIPYPILIALYSAIRNPLTIMMGVPAAELAEGGRLFGFLQEHLPDVASTGYGQLRQSQFISANWTEGVKFSALGIENLQYINYNFLGLDLGDTPKLFFWNDGMTWASIGLFLIPILSGALSLLQMKISQATNPTAGTAAAEQQQRQMKMMNFIFPLISLWICFSMPAALGVYWISTSLLAIVQELILNKYYGRLIALEQEERDARARAREAEWERKRQETERLRAEGLTKENANTSKRKQQARQKAELDELRAAAAREERAKKRAAMGLPPLEEEEIPDSQVGTRRYARGRAYVADRFTNPEEAEAATARAAAESEAYEEAIAEEAAAEAAAAGPSEDGENEIKE